MLSRATVMAPRRLSAPLAACALLSAIGRPPARCGRAGLRCHATLAARIALTAPEAAVAKCRGGSRSSVTKARAASAVGSTSARSEASLPFHRVFFINLDRRHQRRLSFERCAAAQGLGGILARFPAVDGSTLDLATFPQSVVTAAGLERARSPPALVNGVHLTRGALGLILSYYTVLQRIAADSEERHVYIVAEDDAVLGLDFAGRLGQRLAALWSLDPDWDMLHVGYYDDDCVLSGLEGDASETLCRPVQIYGLFGMALRPRGARRLLESLFPLEEQIDSSLARVYSSVNAYASRPSLMKATHSTADNTDIQILPKGFNIGA